MTNINFNNRWIRLVKDLLLFALSLWLISQRSFLATLLGCIAGVWYGRDAWYQIKVLWQEKHYEPQPQEDGKITISRDAKEVDFEKE